MEETKQRQVLCLLMENHSGVLARVSSLFGRRGYNIETITVSTTDDPGVSRLTIVAQGSETDMQQIISQTLKLQEVRDMYVFDCDHSLLRELLLVKLPADETNRSGLRDVAEIYGASIVDLSPDSMVMELTGVSSKIDAFLEVISRYNISEMCRTGVTAMKRGLSPEGD